MTETKIEELTFNLKEYGKMQTAILKLQLTEKMAAIGSKLMSDLLVASAGVIALLFLSVCCAFYLSVVFGSYTLGFFSVGAFYVLLALILMVLRASVLRQNMRDKLITELLKEDSNKSIKPC